MTPPPLPTPSISKYDSNQPLIGILGAGQLGRMLALAGIPLGLRFRFLDPAPNSPAAQLSPCFTGSYEDETTLEAFADGLDAATYEFENVPAKAVETLSRRLPVYPPQLALETSQDRLQEKTLFQRLGIETPFFAPVSNRSHLKAALEISGFPAVLKTRRFGYDGKGQWLLRNAQDADFCWEQIEKTSQSSEISLILEGFIPFDSEVSLIAARNLRGQTVFYPLFQNRHEGGILRLSKLGVPGVSKELQSRAEAAMTSILNALSYTGVLTLEFFLIGDRLIANEMAPRVHNSGHGTIEGASASQFENHLRAILDYPLATPNLNGVSAMWNVLGETPDIAGVLATPSAHLHLYGKSPRPGRKIGHITVLAETEEALAEPLAVIRKLAPQT